MENSEKGGLNVYKRLLVALFYVVLARSPESVLLYFALICWLICVCLLNTEVVFCLLFFGFSPKEFGGLLFLNIG